MVPTAGAKVREFIESQILQFPELNVQVFTADAKTVMAAADVVVVASGTATLEVMLINRPMVACYRATGFTYRVLKMLVKSPYFSLPNILAGERLVPELLQDQVSAENISREVNAWLQNPESCKQLKSSFIEIHEQLRTDAAGTAAIAVLNHIALSQDLND